MLCRVALILLVVVASTASASPSMLDYDLKSLTTPQFDNLQRYQGKPVLMMFFKPECSWCLRQVKAINRLQESCQGKFQALAVGVEGDRPRLKKTLLRMRPEFPAYEASPRLLQDLGGVPATPFTLLADDRGSYRNFLRGYIPLEQLQAELAVDGALLCNT